MNKLFFGILFLVCFSCKTIILQEGAYNSTSCCISDTIFIKNDSICTNVVSAGLYPTTTVQANYRKYRRNKIILNTYTQKPIYYNYSYTILESKYVDVDSLFFYFMHEDERENLLENSDSFSLLFQFQLYLKSTSNKDSILQITDYKVAHFEYPNYPNAVKISFFRPKNMVIDTTKDNFFTWVIGSSYANFDWLKNPNHNHFIIALNQYGEPFINKKMRIKKNTLIETYTNPTTKKKEKYIYKKIPTF